MKSYLIPRLTASQVQVLHEAGVAFYVFDQAIQSYIVEGQDLRLALDRLKATATQSASNFENIVELTLDYYAVDENNLVFIDGTRVAVETNGQGLPKQSFLALINEILGPVVPRSIVLHMPPRGEKVKHTRTPFNDDFYHIHVWASPSGKRHFTPPKSIWGVSIDSREKCFGLTGNGIPLMDTESEYAVGEILEHNLYIHHDLLATGSKNELQLLAAILINASPDLYLSSQDRKKRLKERHLAGRQKSRQLYVRACSQRIGQLIDSKTAALAQKISALGKLTTETLSLIRLDAFGGKAIESETRQAQFAAEFARLKEVPRIKSVTSSQNLIMLKTEKLYVQNRQESSKIHEIGEFLIVIDLRGGRNAVRWFNSTRRVSGVRPAMNAPTVYANGTPMVDEIQESMLELIARLELSVVAELAIQFIETGGDELPFTHLNKWPLATL